LQLKVWQHCMHVASSARTCQAPGWGYALMLPGSKACMNVAPVGPTPCWCAVYGCSVPMCGKAELLHLAATHLVHNDDMIILIGYVQRDGFWDGLQALSACITASVICCPGAGADAQQNR
jgi:hypothetical protein